MEFVIRADAPLIADDMRYLPNSGGKEIRVYGYADVRFILGKR